MSPNSYIGVHTGIPIGEVYTNMGYVLDDNPRLALVTFW